MLQTITSTQETDKQTTISLKNEPIILDVKRSTTANPAPTKSFLAQIPTTNGVDDNFKHGKGDKDRSQVGGAVQLSKRLQNIRAKLKDDILKNDSSTMNTQQLYKRTFNYLQDAKIDPSFLLKPSQDVMNYEKQGRLTHRKSRAVNSLRNSTMECEDGIKAATSLKSQTLSPGRNSQSRQRQMVIIKSGKSKRLETLNPASPRRNCSSSMKRSPSRRRVEGLTSFLSAVKLPPKRLDKTSNSRFLAKKRREDYVRDCNRKDRMIRPAQTLSFAHGGLSWNHSRGKSEKFASEYAPRGIMGVVIKKAGYLEYSDQC
eukprot:CAMPEP_0114987330 /NCGR_PEP_ID=MMETSP0216-20121206/8946_1 /TAXON_ID=223996 /ORGANISM="Protocruzia adherens, Strain Boccale" /LENGTH=314 /DNA_ID=CAMNT_0002349913 /DNA_START=111 /DNA_END=1055 /DNA_ORIENTATION=+